MIGSVRGGDVELNYVGNRQTPEALIQRCGNGVCDKLKKGNNTAKKKERSAGGDPGSSRFAGQVGRGGAGSRRW